MKIQKLFVGIALLFPLFSIGDSPKSEILRIARSIESALLDSKASPEAIEIARQDMKHALSLILSEGPIVPTPVEPLPVGPTKECTDFLYEKYFTSNNAATSFTLANEGCRKLYDLELVKFLWEKHYTSNGAATAMNLSVAQSTKDVIGKLPVVRFAWEKHYTSNGASTAANKAIENAKKVLANSLDCLKNAWEKYYTSSSASKAMDLATDACRP